MSVAERKQKALPKSYEQKPSRGLPAADMGESAWLWGGLPPGATVVVDTAPFIYVLDGHPQFAPLFASLFERAQDGQLHIALSVLTLSEVLTGPHQAGQSALAERYKRALHTYELIAVCADIAELAARVRAQYRLRLPDAVQLATALHIGADALVTHDRDFSRVQGMRILNGPNP